VDAGARSGSRPDIAVLSPDCRAESGRPAAGTCHNAPARRVMTEYQKMTACDLDHRHNERIMQLIAGPIGTFPPLDLRPRFDGAFLYRAPPVIGRLSAGARSRQPTAHSISAGHGRPRIITSISDLSFSSRKAAARRAGGDAATIGGARARKNLRALGRRCTLCSTHCDAQASADALPQKGPHCLRKNPATCWI
jgi:hypothetical protein